LHLIKTVEGVPIGLLIAFVMVGAMALALRVLRRSRGALYLMALAFTITVLQMAQKQANGSQYVTNTDLSTYWVYGSIGLLALIVIFPRLRKATWSKSASGHR
jgi:N-acetyl-1-D-myo-inositol-2-amino-2-deoxy-alpha-D-glucopyranoside deacetylase